MLDFLMYYATPFMATLAAIFVGTIVWEILRTNKRLLFTTPILGRDKEIDQIARRILTGQSSAIIGIFVQERAAILDTLRNSQNFNKLYGTEANRLIFAYVDISAFTKEHTPVDFWQRVLMPLADVKSNQVQKLRQACVDNQYGDYYLDSLMEQLRQEGLRLVVIVPQFDLLLQLASFKIVFFALLRNLASSRHPSSFVPVITMNMTVNQLMSSNKIVGLMGSNLLSYVMEMILAPLPDKQVKPLLADSKYADLASELTGNFPYLVSEFNRVLREVKPETESLMGEDTKNNLKKVFLQQVDGTMQGALNSHFFLTNGASLSLRKLLGELATVPEEDKRELEKIGVLRKINETYQLNPPLLNDFVKS